MSHSQYHPDITALVPRGDGQYATYYGQNDAKHFGDNGIAGSKFTDPSLHRTEDVLALARQQRGSLDGDDRADFIALGCAPAAFWDGIRYLLVKTSGTVGITHSSAWDGTTPVYVTRDKVGAPCSASVLVSEQVTTDFACVVIGKDDDGRELVFSTFPGPVIVPGTGLLDPYEGQTITVDKVRSLFGHDVHLLTRVAN